ncbi:MAG: hypothetical protein RR400_03335 [Clostridia bacterium]
MLKIKKESETLLKKFYKIDGKFASIDLYFQTFQELIENDFGDNKVEKLNGILFEKITEAFSIIPKKYKIKLNIHIKEFGAYTPKEAEQIVKSNIDLKVYSLLVDNGRKKCIAFLMFCFGVGLLIASYFFAGTSLPTIACDITNISGTLLVWESAAFYLLDRNKNLQSVFQFKRKLVEINVCHFTK